MCRNLEIVLPLLAVDGLLAFHDYPDPGRPGVRRVVDEYAGRFGWRRIAQADSQVIFRKLGGRERVSLIYYSTILSYSHGLPL